MINRLRRRERALRRQTNYSKREGMIQSSSSSYYLTISRSNSGLTASIIQMFRLPRTPDRVITSVTPNALRGTILRNTLGAYVQGIILGNLLNRINLDYDRLLIYTPRRIILGSRAHALVQGVRETLDSSNLSLHTNFQEWDLNRYLQRTNTPEEDITNIREQIALRFN